MCDDDHLVLTGGASSAPFGYGLSADLAAQLLPWFRRWFTYVAHAEL